MKSSNLLDDFYKFRDFAKGDTSKGLLLAVDLETTIVDGSAMPWDGAKIVMSGEYDGTTTHTTEIAPLFSGSFLVGHNIKFDLVHLINKLGLEQFYSYISQFSSVVDTSINQYILSGHVWRFPSLKDCAKLYGIDMPDKDELHDNYFSKGLGADHVPEELLRRYLETDVKATHAVALRQFQEASSQELAHFFIQGWATVVYALMEHHGLHYDEHATRNLANDSASREARLEELVVSFMHSKMPGIKGTHDTITNRALSTTLFGYPGLPMKHKAVVGKYKNGKPKTKVIESRVFPILESEFTNWPLDNKLEANPNLGYPVNDTVLTSFHDTFRTSPEGKIASLVKDWRGLSKLRSTYLDAIASSNFVQHPSFNQTVTATGRTSSANPNAQNMPPEVRQLVSREAHKVVSFDFSQLELWAAAQLSRDPNMLRDVETSDVHYEVGKSVYGWSSPADMDKETRRKIKGVNFGYIYGGGANTLAEQSGLPVATVKKIIVKFKARYSVYTEWCNHNIDVANTGPVSDPQCEDGGYVSYVHDWVSPSGRHYKFREVFDKFSGTWKVSPSQVKNYPVQGFATGDFVPLFLVKLFVYTAALQCAKPFAAVHDSASMYVLNTPIDKVPSLKMFVGHTSSVMPTLCASLYNVHLSSVPKVEWEVGPTWT